MQSRPQLSKPATRDPIAAGDVLIQEGTNLPKTLFLEADSGCGGWAPVNQSGSTFDETVRDAGWTFFFVAGEIRAKSFGFDRQKALRGALQRLTTNVKAHHCNSIEISGITSKSFLRFPYVKVSAHMRNLQQGMLLGS
jgi:hypothetical protein